MATLHQRTYQGKRDAIGTLRRFRLSRLESAALFQEMKPDASSSHSLPRIRGHVESRLRPDRETSARTLHRGRPLSGSPAHGPSARPTRPQLAAGLCGYRAQNPCQGRHHLPHLLHDQADHEHRLHDAGRGRPRRARRARPQIYPGVEKPRRVPGRHMAGLSHPAAVAADADRRSDAAHLGPHLRLPAARQRGCSLSRIENRRGRESRHAAIHDRGAGENSAGIFPGRGLELFGFNGRDRLSRRPHQRQAVRAVSSGAHLRSAWHEGYRLLRPSPPRPIVSRPAIRRARKAP